MQCKYYKRKRRCDTYVATNSYKCEAQKIGQIVHFVSKQSMNIDGFGEKQSNTIF